MRTLRIQSSTHAPSSPATRWGKLGLPLFSGAAETFDAVGLVSPEFGFAQTRFPGAGCRRQSLDGEHVQAMVAVSDAVSVLGGVVELARMPGLRKVFRSPQSAEVQASRVSSGFFPTHPAERPAVQNRQLEPEFALAGGMRRGALWPIETKHKNQSVKRMVAGLFFSW